MKLQIVIFLVLIPSVCAAEINEIMYNPAGDDNGNEWIEIFSQNFTDLTNWTIGDINSNDTLAPVRITNSSYSLIVESSSAFNETNASVYFAGSLIGNGLGNSGDSVFLFDASSMLVDSVEYSNEFANGNNRTIEKYNNSWAESPTEGGTPGFLNSFFNFTGNSTGDTNLTEINNTNTTDESNLTANETTLSNETACVAKISINTTKDVFIGEAIKFRHVVNSSSEFSIIYWIEDLFGNVVKDEYETETLTRKSFTPKTKEDDRAYVIKSILKGCEEKYAEKIVVYRAENEASEGLAEGDEVDSESSTSINETTGNNIKFSYELISYPEEIMQDSEASIIVKINSDENTHLIMLNAYLYRGSKKYSDIAEQEFAIEKMESEAFELKFFTNATPGDYKLKVKINKDNQKTDYEISKNVTIAGNSAIGDESNAESEESAPETAASGNTGLNITNAPLIYKSSSSKAETLVPILMMSALAVVSAVLIWKR